MTPYILVINSRFLSHSVAYQQYIIVQNSLIKAANNFIGGNPLIVYKIFATCHYKDVSVAKGKLGQCIVIYVGKSNMNLQM